MANETIEEQSASGTTSSTSTSPRRSHPPGSSSAPRSRRPRRPSANGCFGKLDPHEGDTLLELAAGVGDTGFEAAMIIGESGRLITSDLSPAMLDAARRRGAELGLGNVDYRVINAEGIDLDDDSVDGVLCRFGYMLMPDPVAAFAETRRVLRPGGRVALVWGAMEQNPWIAIAGISLGQRGHIPPPPRHRPGPVQHGERRTGRAPPARGQVHRGADRGGPWEVRIEDADAYLGLIGDTAGPVGLALQGLGKTTAPRSRATSRRACRFAVDRGGFELPCVALCAVAS